MPPGSPPRRVPCAEPEPTSPRPRRLSSSGAKQSSPSRLLAKPPPRLSFDRGSFESRRRPNRFDYEPATPTIQEDEAPPTFVGCSAGARDDGFAGIACGAGLSADRGIACGAGLSADRDARGTYESYESFDEARRSVHLLDPPKPPMSEAHFSPP